jgi:hypothetical protein
MLAVSMPVARLAAVAAACLALLCLLPAAAAARDVPRGFFGAVLDGEELRAAAPATLDGVFARMASSGVESVRVGFHWSEAQPDPAQPPNFAFTDSVVAAAAAHRIEVVPVVIYAPPWARVDPSAIASPPRDPGQYAAYLRALVERYRGKVRRWQVWNEPHLRYQWAASGWERGYGELLRAAERAVHAADPRADVVLAGLTNLSWRELDSLYRRGRIRGAFDVVAVHPYTGEPRNVPTVLRRVRDVMRRRGDARKPVWITELGWPAARGRTSVPRGLRTVVTTDRGMAERLTEAYELLADERRRLRLERVHWYTWASSYSGEPFRFAGLLRYDPALSFAPTPALTAYARSARRHER